MTDPGREPVAQPVASAATAAPSAAAGRPLWQSLLTTASVVTGTSNALTIAAGEGFVSEFYTQARQRLSGDRLSATLKDLATGDHLAQLQGGLAGGATAGFVSPVTDLLGLGVFAEQAPMIAAGFARRIAGGGGALVAELEKLGQDFQAFKGEAKTRLKEIFSDPAKVAEILAKVGPQATQAAHDAGTQAARAVVGLFESAPEKEHPPPATIGEAFTRVKEGDLAGPFSLLTSRGTNLREYVFRTPWAKTGYDVGHAVGAVVANLLLLVFSEGVGNALAEIGAWVGKIAPLLARGAEGLVAVGRGIAAAEALIGKIIAKGVSAIKPLEALLAPLFRLLGRFQSVLRKLFGVAEHGAERALTAGAGAVADEALERGAGAAAPRATAPGPGKVVPLKRPTPPARSAVSAAQESALEKVPKGRGDVHPIRPGTAAKPAPKAPHPEAAAAAKPQEAVLEDAVSQSQPLKGTGTGDVVGTPTGTPPTAAAKPPGRPKLSVVRTPPAQAPTASPTAPVRTAPATRPATPPATPPRVVPAPVPESELAALERRIEAVGDERLFEELQRARSAPDAAQRVKDIDKRLAVLEEGPHQGAEVDPGAALRDTPGKGQPKRYGVGNFSHKNLEHLRAQLSTRQVPRQFQGALRSGRIITVNQMPNGLRVEEAIGVTARVDRMGTNVIYEIKPNTAGSIEEGLARVEEYVRLANAKKLGGHSNWTGKVVIYDWAAAQRFIP